MFRRFSSKDSFASSEASISPTHKPRRLSTGSPRLGERKKSFASFAVSVFRNRKQQEPEAQSSCPPSPLGSPVCSTKKHNLPTSPLLSSNRKLIPIDESRSFQKSTLRQILEPKSSKLRDFATTTTHNTSICFLDDLEEAVKTENEENIGKLCETLMTTYVDKIEISASLKAQLLDDFQKQRYIKMGIASFFSLAKHQILLHLKHTEMFAQYCKLYKVEKDENCVRLEEWLVLRNVNRALLETVCGEQDDQKNTIRFCACVSTLKNAEKHSLEWKILGREIASMFVNKWGWCKLENFPSLYEDAVLRHEFFDVLEDARQEYIQQLSTSNKELMLLASSENDILFPSTTSLREMFLNGQGVSLLTSGQIESVETLHIINFCLKLALLLKALDDDDDITSMDNDKWEESGKKLVKEFLLEDSKKSIAHVFMLFPGVLNELRSGDEASKLKLFRVAFCVAISYLEGVEDVMLAVCDLESHGLSS